MICRRLTERIRYDGSQLSAHWILAHAGLVGDAIVAFRGPCDVARDEIADLETAGIRVIQVDEPALRELLPLRHPFQRPPPL